MKSFIYILLCFICLKVNGQVREIDSLKRLLKTLNKDTESVKTLNNYAWLIKQNNIDSAILFSSEALDLAKKLNWQKGIGNSSRKLGVFHWLEGNFPKALEYYFIALKINETQNDKEGIFATCQNIAIIYNDLREYKKALNYYTKSLALAEEMKDKNRIGLTLGNLGGLYHSIKDVTKSLEFYERALKIEEELGNKQEIAREIGNIGNVYSTLNNYPRALEYIFKAVKMFEELNDHWSVAVNYGNIGIIYAKMKKYKEAETYIKKALDFSIKMKALDFTASYEQSLSDLYTESKQTALAFEHYKKYISARDTIFNEANLKKETRSEISFDFEKKQAIAKAEQEKKDALAAEAFKQQKQQRNYFIGGFVLMLTLAFFILRGYRQKQKANLALEEKNKLIEEKQKEILDSIHYAKRIQNALLPSEKYIERNLDELRKEG